MYGMKLAAILLMVFVVSIPLRAQQSTTITWKMLENVRIVKEKNLYTPIFAPELEKLDGKKVSIEGYMIPLDVAMSQNHFILGFMPPGCEFCVPGGGDTIIEVRSVRPVTYMYDPVNVSGRLELIRDNDLGLYFRILEAQVRKP